MLKHRIIKYSLLKYIFLFSYYILTMNDANIVLIEYFDTSFWVILDLVLFIIMN